MVQVPRFGVHRRSLVKAVAAAWWLDADQDAAAIRAAADLADMIDSLRATRLAEQDLLGVRLMDSKAAWHAATVHGKYLQVLESLRLTPSTRPEQVADDTADLITSLKQTLADG